MTTIIILGESLTIPNAHDATEQLVNFHAIATQSRFQHNLDALVKDPPKAYLKDLPNFPDYKAILAGLDDRHPVWYVRDDRLVFLLPEFGRLVRGEKLIYNDTYPSKSEYIKDLQALNKKCFEAFKGPKLHLTKKDEGAVETFVWGQDNVVVSNPFDEPGDFGKEKAK